MKQNDSRQVVGSIFLPVFCGICAILATSSAMARTAEIAGGVTAVYQNADDDRVDSELIGSLDLVATLEAGYGLWTLRIEGNTTPSGGHVAALFGEANGDAGSALDRNGKGRLQVSELLYSQPTEHGEFAVGLLDMTGFLDASIVANDETAQFLAAGFVNNPTIEFPDYTLGAVFNRTPEQPGFGYIAALGSSNGLGDNPKASYSELVDVSDKSKGVFGALELSWNRETMIYRLGAWINSADHAELAGASTDENNAGLYLSADWLNGPLTANMRLGIADKTVSEAAEFVAIAGAYQVDKITYGLGFALTGASGDLSGDVDDTRQVEMYVRFDVCENVRITPSVQWLENSGFDASNADFDDSVLVTGVRLSATF